VTESWKNYNTGLEVGVVAGAIAERERIINLIGDKFECIQHYDCEPLINITCSEMYALIKGDNK
jgi:hypothetical protein